MTKKEKWIVDKDDGLRLFYGDENFNGSAYPCNDIVFMKMIADKLNKLEKENEQLKHDASVLIQSNKDYRIENEQLKDSLLSTSKELQYGVKKVQKLAKENEQLKKKCEYMEDVLNNQGYEVVFNGERWVIE